MDEAVLALRNLARQCSDSSAMEAVTRHLFAILGGEQAFVAMGWFLNVFLDIFLFLRFSLNLF